MVSKHQIKGERAMLCCKVCKKEPHKIDEYIRESREYGLTPEEFVIREDGTYNKITNKFICTACYCKQELTNLINGGFKKW